LPNIFFHFHRKNMDYLIFFVFLKLPQAYIFASLTMHEQHRAAARHWYDETSLRHNFTENSRWLSNFT